MLKVALIQILRIAVKSNHIINVSLAIIIFWYIYDVTGIYFISNLHVTAIIIIYYTKIYCYYSFKASLPLLILRVEKNLDI